MQLDDHEPLHYVLGGGAFHIDSYYCTRWFDLGSAAFKKRWKRPSFVLKGGVTGVIKVDSYKNYDLTVATRHFDLVTTTDSSAGTWDTDLWDTGVWGRDLGVQNELQRGSQLGSAYSVALKLTGPATNVDWGVDALNLKFIPRRVTN